MSIPEGEEREKAAESLSGEIIAENFPNLKKKKLDIQVNEANRTPHYLNKKRCSLRQTIFKLSKVSDKEF